MSKAKSRRNGNRYKATDFVEAIKGSGGIISVIAERMGCNWSTAQRWIEDYPTVKAAYDAEKEKVLDSAESVILNNIVKNKDSADAKWYLSKKGKDRGYGTKLDDDELISPDQAMALVEELVGAVLKGLRIALRTHADQFVEREVLTDVNRIIDATLHQTEDGPIYQVDVKS